MEIDSYDDDENTGKLCVELPNDPILRKRVLDWTGEIAEEQGFELTFRADHQIWWCICRGSLFETNINPLCHHHTTINVKYLPSDIGCGWIGS